MSREALAYYLSNRNRKKFRVEDYCFDKQIAFKRDPSRFKVALCTRRSGKTVECAADLIETAEGTPDSVCVYITLSRKSAKKIIWKDLLKILKKQNIQHKVDNSELSISFPNNSIIYVSGAKDASEIEKFRGLGIKLCYIDEAQSFRSYIEEMIDDVIAPALFDNNGTLCLIGTPSPVPTGYFYNCTTNPEWSNHSWTLFENPWIKIKSGKSAQELLNEELKRRGVTVDDPKIQREFFAKWSVDTNSLVFRYSDYNNYTEIVQDSNWEYVVGVDIGFDDADAIAVLGWHKHKKEVYLVYEQVNRRQDITTLAQQINTVIKKYDPLKVVLDTGGLGKKIAQEINKRHESSVVAAEKSRKFEFIELLNDALRTKRLFAKKDSIFAQDCYLVEWDKAGKDKEKLKVSDRYHSDITDAVLYAYRECLHWLSEPEKPVFKYQSAGWTEQEEEEMLKIAQKQSKTYEADEMAELGFY